MGVVLVVQGCGDAEVAEEDGAVVVDEEVGGFDVAVDEAVYVEVAVAVAVWRGGEVERGEGKWRGGGGEMAGSVGVMGGDGRWVGCRGKKRISW